MFIEVDLSVVPPSLALRDSEDFKMFKVVVKDAEHVWVDIDRIKALAGERGQDSDWLKGLEGMIAYAGQHDYIDDQGRMRGHVERA
ncbi:MAG: hypothetical protein H0V22_08115 [Solirubrobacterales bacterium]|nr:hypothetical protein [Solirubrobacterales bacterium]